MWEPAEPMGTLRPALCVGSSPSRRTGAAARAGADCVGADISLLCRRQGVPGQAGLWAGKGGGRGGTQCSRPQQDILVALCALRPDTWSLHTGPCPGCLSSPCLGPNLCQAEADTGTGVTSIWLPGRNWPKKNSSHKDIPSTYLLDVRSESPSRPRQMVALMQSIFTRYQSHGMTTRWLKVGGWRWGIRPLQSSPNPEACSAPTSHRVSVHPATPGAVA